jgi:hypothetical protein
MKACTHIHSRLPEAALRVNLHFALSVGIRWAGRWPALKIRAAQISRSPLETRNNAEPKGLGDCCIRYNRIVSDIGV